MSAKNVHRASFHGAQKLLPRVIIAVIVAFILGLLPLASYSFAADANPVEPHSDATVASTPTSSPSDTVEGLATEESQGTKGSSEQPKDAGALPASPKINPPGRVAADSTPKVSATPLSPHASDSARASPEGTTAPTPVRAPRSATMRNGYVSVPESIFHCKPGFVYGSPNNKTIYEYAPNSTESLHLTQSTLGGISTGALALAFEGTAAYLEDGTWPNHKVHTYDALGGQWTIAENFNIPQVGKYSLGAVHPITGEYFFANYRYYWIRNRLEIYAYNPQSQSVRAVGQLQLNHSTRDGDMAFTRDGTLYILRPDFTKIDLYKVNSTDIPLSGDDIDRTIPYTTVLNGIDDVGLDDVVGIAFDTDGKLFITDGTTMKKLDPVSGAVEATSYPSPDNSNDLATCFGTPSITALSDIKETRIHPNDQFQLTIHTGSTATGTPVASEVTTGSELGLQSVKIHRAAVNNGTTYTVSETMAATATSSINAYNITHTCTDHTGTVVSEGSGATATFSVPGDNNMPNNAWDYECTFTNTPKRATVEVTKTDKTSGAILPGATLELWLDANHDGKLDPADTRVGSPVTTGKNGKATWDNLLHSRRYFVKEIEAPSGYDLAEPHAVVVDKEFATQGPVTLNVEDPRQVGKVTWLVHSDKELPLAGSRWTLTHLEVPGGGTPRTIDDCVKAPCTGADKDPRPGIFEVDNLEWGDYRLQEVAAAPGYVLDVKNYDFTIAASTLEYNFTSAFVHTKVDAPQLPLTGGISRHFFFSSGGLLLVTAIGTGLWALRRRLAALNTLVHQS
ncbi:MAG: SpaA isopeptide-forming pilin-related protein [Actinomycetaceae bacterium]|nr:SpaA isopeptide-forming pilin-related protein [Actinomycetaceae bacterium]